MGMDDRPRYTHRTVRLTASADEHKLAKTLFGILSAGTHDLPGIIAALNAADVRPAEAALWSEENFKAEMERLGAYANSSGAAIGAHSVGIAPASTDSREPLTAKTGGSGE
jgi:hypothetical protein